jgi:hypothetical protein
MTAPPAPEPTPGVDACGDQLRQHFPALFVGPPRPLKLRIQADIQQRAPGVFAKAALSAFLRRYTGRTGYLIALTRAPHRFDLDGAPAAEISAEHRQAALDELARRRAVHAAREDELREQQRRRAELLHAFETTTLGLANFCALKGVSADALPALLELARREAEQRRAPLAPGSAAAPPPRPGPAAQRSRARRGAR